jgi:hypothetical protein
MAVAQSRRCFSSRPWRPRDERISQKHDRKIDDDTYP